MSLFVNFWETDHAAILENARKLHAAFEGKYTCPADCTNPEILTRLRTKAGSDYVFVVNDAREFGTYVGRHGLVMENGRASSGEVSLLRTEGHVNDLIAGREVKTEMGNGRLHSPVSLRPCEGRFFFDFLASVPDLDADSLAALVP